MKTNNYSTTDTATLSNSSEILMKAYDKQLMDILRAELSKMKAAKETSAKQLAA